MWDDGEYKYYEVIDRNALDEADVSDVILQYDHQGKVFARQSNQTLIIEPDDHGLFVCADLSKSSAAKELHEEISSGLVTRMSWAFIVGASRWEDDNIKKTSTRTITKIKKVFDVSAVSIPANSGTEISARSLIDGVIETRKQEMLEQARQLELAKKKFKFIEVKK